MVADRVRALREQAGLSQSDVASRMDELGVPWKRTTVVNLEKRGSQSRGRATAAGRDAITLQEWLALAIALDVAPVDLLVDLTSAEPFAPTPARAIDVSWRGLRWLVGDEPLPESYGDESWHDSSQRLRIALRVMQLADRLARRAAAIVELSDSQDETSADGLAAGRAAYRNRQHAEDLDTAHRLSQLLSRARHRGLRTPPLAAGVREAAAALGVSLDEDGDDAALTSWSSIEDDDL